MYAEYWENSKSIPFMAPKAYFCINKPKLLTQGCSSSRKITPFCTGNCSTPAISVCRFCIMEGWHSLIHPKSCSHAGTLPSFDKTSIRRVKISHWQTDVFPPQYMYKSTTGRNCIFVLIWKPQGFSAPCRGKEQTNNGYFLWTLLPNTSPTKESLSKRLERTGISTIQTIAFTCCLQFI